MIEILRRFRAYEALLSFQTSRDVVTYVVYSNGILNTKSILQTGINEYSVKAISMYEKDGNIAIQEVEEKLNFSADLRTATCIKHACFPINSHISL